MHLPSTSTQTAAIAEPRREKDTRLTGTWLLLAHVVWGVPVIALLILFVFSLPMYFSQLFTVSNGILYVPWQLTPTGEETLYSLGISLSFYAPCAFGLGLFISCTWVAIAGILFWRKSDDWMALLAAFIFVWWGTSNISVVFVPADWAWFFLNQASVLTIGNISVFLFFYLFPDGRFVPRWIGWLALLQFLILASQAFPSFPWNLNVWPEALVALLMGSLVCGIAGSQIYRYRRLSSPVQRQQTKWVVFAFAVVFSGLLGDILVVNVLNLPLPDLLVQLLDPILWHLVPILIPLSLVFAILRYRLWDIDLIINRTLVYGVLTVSIVTLYTLVVVGLGSLLQSQGNFALSLLATGLIAVLFQPLRNRLQRTANRLMYGERDEPYRVLTRLGSRLEATLAPDAVLPTIVETVAQALKLPYAAITLKQGDVFPIASSYGSLQADPVRMPLVYQGEQVGELVLAPRAPGESFTSADRALLEDLARHAGIAAYAVCLTTDLQHSRERLVTTREEERRRLRRDLHDGLGPQLASLTLKLETARNRLTHDALAQTLLSDLAQRTQTMVADIRRLVYALRPPALDELGLVSALRELALQYSDQVTMHLDTPDCLPEFPAAVEVAVYRIAQEALTNVVRHADAHQCVLGLALDETSGVLTLSIQDDGCGLSPSRGVGVGLVSMRERAEELGGTWNIGPAERGGTLIQTRLPYARLQSGDVAFVAPHVVLEREE